MGDMWFLMLWPGKPERCVLKDDSAPEAMHLVAAPHSATVFEESTEPVGVLSLFPPPPAERGTAEAPCGRAQFRKLAVEPACRRCGVGRTLVDTAAAEARRVGAATLFCHAREAQAGFYEAQGFARCGEPFRKYEAGELYVEMETLL